MTIKFKAFYDGMMHPVNSLKFRGDDIYVEISGYANSPKVGDCPRGRNCKLVRFTGLKDVNGKDIYEGDILKLVIPLGPDQMDPDIGIVMEVTWHGEDAWFLVLGGGSRAEIIGNIYKNTELLKKSKSIGHKSSEPCVVCDEVTESNQVEPRFGFTVCSNHYSSPPAELLDNRHKAEGDHEHD